MEIFTRRNPPKPFLRWAGGKTWLTKKISDFLPREEYLDYHEPFLGGGSIFFSLLPKNRVYLNDSNKELVNAYSQLSLNVEEVITELSKFNNTAEDYYKVRSGDFKSKVKQAARFIYLNQTSFNGIYRVNGKGEYNVPYGHRKKNFLDSENLRAVNQILQNVSFSSNDFSTCIENVGEGDLVFLDPPYTISHNNNGFFKYNQKLFSEQDQYRLSELVDQIKERRAYYILTNAAHLKVREIFDKGDTIVELKRASLIGGTNAKRGKYGEYIFTNCI